MILGIDTTGDACSAAFAEGGAVIASRSAPMHRGHAEALLPMISDMTAQAGCGLDRVAMVVATAGPGSFTGVRVGLAAARGLALALGVPAQAASTLQALAAAARQSRPAPLYVAAIAARRGQLYVQAFSADLAPCDDAALLTTAQAARRYGGCAGLAVGTAAPGLAAQAAQLNAIAAPGEGLAMVLAAAVASSPALLRLWPPQPFYLRPPDAKPPAAAPFHEVKPDGQPG